jgi:hypothetical protein
LAGQSAAGRRRLGRWRSFLPLRPGDESEGSGRRRAFLAHPPIRTLSRISAGNQGGGRYGNGPLTSGATPEPRICILGSSPDPKRARMMQPDQRPLRVAQIAVRSASGTSIGPMMVAPPRLVLCARVASTVCRRLVTLLRFVSLTRSHVLRVLSVHRRAGPLEFLVGFALIWPDLIQLVCELQL